MITSNDYSILKKFISKYQPLGFTNINHHDSLMLELEKYLTAHKQFFYVADLLQMKIRFVSQSAQGVLGVDPNTFDLSSILSRIHPEDYHKHNLARAMVIKKGYELLIYKQGISVHSICSRVRHETGNYIYSVVQALSFFDSNHTTVFTVVLLTDMMPLETDNYKYHYYIGNDPAMFRYPDKALLKIGINFSEREFEIIKLIADGEDSQQIASRLSLSLNTVNTHRRNILKKTKMPTLRELIGELREKGTL